MPTETKPAPITNGALLTKALAKSGTGEAKVAVCRQKLSEVWLAEHRTATSEEVVAALEESERVGAGTVDKARRLAGLPTRAQAAAAAVVPIEDRLLADATPDLDADGWDAEDAGDEEAEGDGGDEAPAAPEFVGPAKKVPPKAGGKPAPKKPAPKASGKPPAKPTAAAPGPAAADAPPDLDADASS